MKSLPLQPTCLIPLDNGLAAIVDQIDLHWLNEFNWHAVRHGRAWYAETRIGRAHSFKKFSMHRMIARTPRGHVCHHRNRNSLDNRSSNLLNMTRHSHEFLHRNNTLLIKFEQDTDPTQPGLGKF